MLTAQPSSPISSVVGKPFGSSQGHAEQDSPWLLSKAGHAQSLPSRGVCPSADRTTSAAAVQALGLTPVDARWTLGWHRAPSILDDGQQLVSAGR